MSDKDGTAGSSPLPTHDKRLFQEAHRGTPRLPAFFLAVAILVSLVEFLLLGRTSAYSFEGNVTLKFFSMLFHPWFWVTSVYLMWCTAWLALAIRRPRWISLVTRGLAMTAAILGLLIYGTSWGFFLKTGQFATIEVVQFAAGNWGMLLDYLRHAEPTQIWSFGCVLAAAITLPISFLVLMSQSQWFRTPVKGSGPGQRVVWWLATLLLGAVLYSVTDDPLPDRRNVSIDVLVRRLNPLVTLAASGAESLFCEAIEPILDHEDLTRIKPEWSESPASVVNDESSIVFVAIESLRHDVIHMRRQGREIMPTLNGLANRGLQLTRAYAQSTHSDYSDPSVYSSLYPLRSRRHHYYSASEPWPKTFIYDVLKQAGYSTAIFSSQNEAWGGMDLFLKSRGLDLFRDAQNSGLPTHISRYDTGAFQGVSSGMLTCGSLDDAHTTDAAIAWIKEQASHGKPFFLGMNLQSSHFPYELPPDGAHPFEPCAINFDASFVSYPIEKVEVVKNAYLNSLHYCDQQLARLTTALREIGRWDNTILVVYGDNGEAFHENGLVTHAQAPFEPGIHVAAVIHAPKQLSPGTESYPVELIDLAPTVLGISGHEAHPNFQGINALSPERPAVEQRLLFFHVENPIARADAVLLAGRWKLQHDRMSGRESLFDLDSDPGERRNLIGVEIDRAGLLHLLLNTWRMRQLSYYHFPSYYENFYPPCPPHMNGLKIPPAPVSREKQRPAARPFRL
jgi:arylsulfatase A-like enzyme